MKKLTIFLIVVFAIAFFTNAQNPQWINYTNGDEISSLTIDNNSVWIGTYGGLVLHDINTNNQEFYNKANSGLPNNYITATAVEDDEVKWIGIWGAGLAASNGSNWVIYNTYNSGLPDNRITSIAISGTSVVLL